MGGEVVDGGSTTSDSPGTAPGTPGILGARGILIVGCGYSGLALARLLHSRGIPAWGTTRSSARAEAIRAAGAEPVVWEAGAPLPDALRGRFDAVVDTAGPAWRTGEEPTEAILASLSGTPLRSFVYLSSTSVYGDCHGDIVDEDTPCAPGSPAGERRLAVERLLLARHALDGLPVSILRLPAIYGPGRDGLAGRILQGTYAVIGDGAGFGNRIHVEDLAAAALAATERATPGRVTLVTDDEPTTRAEIADSLADLLGVPRPGRIPLDEARRTMDPSVVAMFSDSKRLSNARMKRELGVTLRYPTWREGFREILAAMRDRA